MGNYCRNNGDNVGNWDRVRGKKDNKVWEMVRGCWVCGRGGTELCKNCDACEKLCNFSGTLV